ncbi:MAG TPA: CBS domain-containing protein [Syntrophorhabdaceae bacterium]|jgi:acetoin utilization protein AcuB|nr:CBS domain-containing protein [Syntrophorhabdaceae bacterium]MDI9562229.1 CBS domain-containing protein [Pseudomonadota bacterium]MBV6504712.1 Inosine-5'-monophosphate dehydrogenase [Syntrophorhabdaceae bacterium]HNQ64054.1 CBS domain-containing protein [Syntrophorhabdaceae bacterium]HNZ58392.1 CBS domain-containing protein [Syntrophorhabdaceae bacterium]
MLVKDIMVSNVITVTSDTYVLDAERIMEFHGIGRLPVVDKGKLVGLITKDDILKASPSSTTPANQRQLFYLISKLTVKDIMKTDVVTVSPDTTVEKAVAIAQKNKIGCLPVVEGDRVLGIVSQTDAFYKILCPLLGIGIAGTRIIIYDAGTKEESNKIMDIINKTGLRIKTFWIPPVGGRFDLVLHLETEDADTIMQHLRTLGYRVDIRECTA